jgi:hypothetical protein
MKDDWCMFIGKDELYEEYKIPKLPLPMKPDDLPSTLESGSIPIPLLVDNLIEYITENPEEREAYSPVIAGLAYQAGIAGNKPSERTGVVNYLRIAREYDPLSLPVIIKYGYKCLEMKDYPAALKEFKYAESLDPSLRSLTQWSWLGMACCHFLMGEVEDGEEVVKTLINKTKALEISQEEFHDSMEIWLGMSRAFDPSGKFEQAIRKYGGMNAKGELYQF